MPVWAIQKSDTGFLLDGLRPGTSSARMSVVGRIEKKGCSIVGVIGLMSPGAGPSSMRLSTAGVFFAKKPVNPDFYE